MKKVIILGGSGYMGTRLMEKWMEKETDIQFISVSRHGKPKKASEAVLKNENIQWISADVLNVNTYLSKLPQSADYIVDLVGTATANGYEQFEKINVGPVQVMLKLMDQLSIPEGLYISGVIGMPGKNKPFVQTKKMAESIIEKSGKNIHIVKPSLVYGDRPEVKAMVPMMKFMGLFSSKYKPIHYTDLVDKMLNAFGV